MTGNHVVGRLADRHTITVLLAGLILNAIFLAGFALFARLGVPAVITILGAGLAVLGIASLLPELSRTGRAQSPTANPAEKRAEAASTR
ncbi:hypothetical protein [Streptosporangium saharense]|uniref:hypothetical protein n=1 Tax=Streptosporangium saharense TaxID=1706840 RepID=UPI00332B5D1D